MVVVVVVVVAVVDEVRVGKLVKLVQLVKLISIYFFDILTSKNAQNLIFNTFDLEMCFAPQRACTFSTSQRQKVVGVRPWCVLYHFDLEMCFSATTACNFSIISSGKSWLRTRQALAPQRPALFRPS